MDKKKKIYLAPDIAVTQVETESAICSGSVSFGGDENKGVTLDAQQNNTDFQNDNGWGSGTDGIGWD